MTSKPVSSELTQAPSLASRLFSFLDKKRLKIWLWVTLSVLLVVACVYIEIQTSLLQSWFFTRTNEQLSYQLTEGQSTAIAFPRSAPFDYRRGYSKLPAFQSRLEGQGYQVAQQVRQSEKMVQLIKRGISPPYVEPPETGLDISGANGAPLFRHAQSEFLFAKMDDIPPLLVKTLLFLENRDLDHSRFLVAEPRRRVGPPSRPPLFYIASSFGIEVPVQGGSTPPHNWRSFAIRPEGAQNRLLKIPPACWRKLSRLTAKGGTLARGENGSLSIISIPFVAAAPSYGEIYGLGEGFSLGSECS
jgi:hypothetical protein